MLLLRTTTLFVCPSDDHPEINRSRASSAWLAEVVDNENLVSRVVMSATSNYVGVNSVHPATCFLHERRDGSTFPPKNHGVFAAINKPMELRNIVDGMSNTLMVGERAWKYRAGGKVYDAFATKKKI